MPAALLFAGSRLAVFLPPFPVFFFMVKKLSYIGKTLAKPRAREGQRPRCPRFADARAARTLPTICRRPPSPDGRIASVRPVAQNENSLRNDYLAFDETVNK